MRSGKAVLIASTIWLLASQASCSSTPVAASCPPPPPLPAVVEAQRNSPLTLSVSPEQDYLEESTQAFKSLVDDLQQVLNKALLPSPDSKSVPPGR